MNRSSHWFKVVVIGVLLIGAFQAQGANLSRKAMSKKTNQYIKEGLFIGGESGRSFSLLRVRRNFSKKLSMERLVFDMGDEKKKPLRGLLNYYQVAVDSKAKKLVLTLSQVRDQQMTPAQLKRQLRPSPLIKRVVTHSDPIDGSLVVEIFFKKKVAVEAFDLPSIKKGGRIVLDFRELNSGKKVLRKKKAL